MRGFLFDENLPRVPSLQTRLPVTHAVDLGQRPTDSQLWTHALQNDLAIVTKDADFSQRIVLGAPPPRVIHLRGGNMRRRDFAAWLERIRPRIESTIATHKLVNVYRDRIEAVKQEEESGLVGRVTPCAPGHELATSGAHGVTRPTSVSC